MGCGRSSEEAARVASRVKEEVTEDRLTGVFLTALVVFVLLAWASALVYLGFHFL